MGCAASASTSLITTSCAPSLFAATPAARRPLSQHDLRRSPNDAVVLDTDTYAPQSDKHAIVRLTRPLEVGADAQRCQTRATFPPQAFSVLLKAGFRTARHRPVVIDAPCLGYVHIAAQQRIRLADLLRQCVGEDVPVATAWVDTDDPPPPYWPASVAPLKA